MRIWIICGFLAGVLCAAGCTSPNSSDSDPASGDSSSVAEQFEPTSSADSLALRVYEAHGGSAWEQAPYVRFDFAVEQGDEEAVVARHLWNRTTGQYRVEWTNEDTDWVALLDLHSDEEPPVGQVFEEGQEVVGSAAEEPLQQAYQRYINDTYWLLAPLKVLDSGVNRSLETTEAFGEENEDDVLHLTFGDVGLTPGDRYWMRIDSETNRVAGWAFHLENMPEDADPRTFDWMDETTFEHDAGTIYLYARKQSADGDMAITMPTLRLPDTVDDALFEQGNPNQLQ
ncbi:MAG: hypothetical protein R6U20_12780 [Longimonas sp.]|uniref:hypothetical protein n=1 Tax=Longimonas sp. TaxID=2039626 RepID=UPI0039770875